MSIHRASEPSGFIYSNVLHDFIESIGVVLVQFISVEWGSGVRGTLLKVCRSGREVRRWIETLSFVVSMRVYWEPVWCSSLAGLSGCLLPVATCLCYYSTWCCCIGWWDTSRKEATTLRRRTSGRAGRLRARVVQSSHPLKPFEVVVCET